MQQFVRRMEFWVAVLIASAMVFGATFTITHRIAELIMYEGPITADMRIVEPIGVDDNWFSAQVIGTKREEREACVPRRNSFSGFRLEGEVWVEAKFEFRENFVDEDVRPSGYQSFGIWAWQITDRTQAVKLTSIHDCPSGDIVASTYGPFEVVRD